MLDIAVQVSEFKSKVVYVFGQVELVGGSFAAFHRELFGEIPAIG